jgi:hypothetical protein
MKLIDLLITGSQIRAIPKSEVPGLLGELAALLAVPVESAKFCPSMPESSIRWRGSKQYVEEVSALCAGTLKKFDGLVKRLAATGLLTESEANKLNAQVHLEVRDLRKDKTTPLSEISIDRVVMGLDFARHDAFRWVWLSNQSQGKKNQMNSAKWKGNVEH